jgi:hypothetical protein
MGKPKEEMTHLELADACAYKVLDNIYDSDGGATEWITDVLLDGFIPGFKPYRERSLEELLLLYDFLHKPEEDEEE